MIRSSLTGDLVARALAARPGPDARAAASAALDDLLTSSLLAAGEPAARALVADGTAAGGAGGWVIGHPDAALTPPAAALAGGFQAHLLDIDDTSEAVRGHPSAVLFPALFAVAGPDVAGADLLDAYVVGLEVMARLARALPSDHYARGWHQTGTVGGLAAALAGARLADTDAQTAARAMAIAAQSSAALRVQFGTEAKPLAAGLAARSAVDAVRWAAAGLSAAPDVLAGPAGWLAVHRADRDAATATLLDGFGDSWSLLTDGLWVKDGPYCSAAMAPVQAARQLARPRRGAPERVVVRLRPGADMALIHRVPATGEQGRFSLEYLVALTLLDAPLDLSTLGTGPARPDAVALAQQVIREEVPASPLSVGRDRWTEVVVHYPDGDTASATVTVPLGSPGRPLDDRARSLKRRAAAGPDAELLEASVAQAANRPWSATVDALRRLRPPNP